MTIILFVLSALMILALAAFVTPSQDVVEKDDIIAHFNLGNALQDKGMLELAGLEYREVLRINPQNADAHSNLGSVLRRQGKLDEAIAEDREAIRIDNTMAQAYYNLGGALQEQGDRSAAAQAFRDFLRLVTSSTESDEK